MLFQPTRYLFPESLEAALELLSESENCLIVSGGVTLHELEKRDLLSNVTTLIDLGKLGLEHIRSSGEVLEVESSVTFSALSMERAIRETEFLALLDALERFTPIQVRNLATIGGAVCSGVPFLDLPTILCSLNANLLVKGPQGDRTIPIRNFYHDFFEIDLKRDEILVKISLRRRSGKVGSAFRNFKRTAVDIPIINASASVSLNSDNTCEEASVFLGGVDRVVRSAEKIEERLVDSAIDEGSVERAVGDLEDLVSLESFQAGIQYKRHIAKLLIKEVVLQANERAKENLSSSLG